MTVENKDFISPSKGVLSVFEMLAEIKSYMEEDSEQVYCVVIGTDSQSKRSGNNGTEIDFVTAVVVHRIGSGARYFWRKDTQHRIYSLPEKIQTETIKSIQFAEEFVPLLRSAITEAVYELEIHIDVGPSGPTREMIKEVVGMVTGSGYTARTKPESYGASCVADRHT